MLEDIRDIQWTLDRELHGTITYVTGRKVVVIVSEDRVAEELPEAFEDDAQRDRMVKVLLVAEAQAQA
ncbi:hypothetical protein [Microvirga sp. Mcv34]|uniref:hypothetical protein n=1 Tax=Microvirga sp. Mcv34 TaxID=2926016 RepID=UPI0021CAA5C5|nr:hypothetical protein [Microvirga sp. Mcv34]